MTKKRMKRLETESHDLQSRDHRSKVQRNSMAKHIRAYHLKYCPLCNGAMEKTDHTVFKGLLL